MRKYIYRTDWNLSYSLSVLFAAKWRAHSDGAVAIGREDIELLDVRDDKRRHAQHYGKHPNDHGREDSQRFCLVKRRERKRRDLTNCLSTAPLFFALTCSLRSGLTMAQ